MQPDFFSPASRGSLQQILMNQADDSPQIVVPAGHAGENSRDLLLPGKDKIITLRGYRAFNRPSPALNPSGTEQFFLFNSPDIPNLFSDSEGQGGRWVAGRQRQGQLKLGKGCRSGEQKLHSVCEINTKINTTYSNVQLPL